jgi:hypothetical protein
MLSFNFSANGFPVRGCAKDFSTKLCTKDESINADCYVCDDDGCNAIVYPYIGRLQCHTCVNGDCEPTDENIELCPRFGADEQCASIFDENQDKVIARGCISTLETQYQTKCNQNDGNCLKCAYDNCNQDDSKKKTQFCISCNSQEDPECLKDNLKLQQRCLTNRCYTRFVGQYIERGCMDDLQSCLSPNCVECQGTNCNNKKFPTNRISCKSCQFGSCKGKTTEKICNRYIDNEACITFYGDKNNVVLRDCYSDIAEGARNLCDDPKNLECTKCVGNVCNIDSKRRGNKCYKCEGIECFKPTIGDTVDCLSNCYVGINSNGETVRGCASDFSNSAKCGKTDQTCTLCDDDFCNTMTYPTENRLVCQKCQGDDCGRLNVIVEACERLHKDEKCVTIFNDQDDVIERGCLSALHNTQMCSSTNNKNCLTCGFDECNIETSIKETYRCVSCHSKDEDNCILNTKSTSVIGCTENKCYSRLDDYHYIERGCAKGIECKSPYCQTCTGEKCNTEIFPRNRHSCYYCSGDHCALGHRPEERLCLKYSSTDQNCMTLYGEGKEVIYRGCYIDAVQETRDLCDDTKDLTCTKCQGKLCNDDKVRRGTKCIKCEGLDCFAANDRSNSVDCTSGCFVGLNKNGEVKRDCAEKVSTSSSCVKDDSNTNGTCYVCNDDYCNAIIYPMKNRLNCLSCVGDLCEEKSMDDKYCERIHSNEKCVTLFNNANKVIERGCISSLRNAKACDGNNANCLQCAFNRCNIQESRQDVYHCVSCNSKDNPNCVHNSTDPEVAACPTNLCYSRLISNTNSNWYHVEKGCAASLEHAGSCTGSSCTVCEGDRCNNIIYPVDRMSCLTCRNEQCNRPTIPRNYCQLYNRQMQGCITLYDTNDKVNYRGCFSDAAMGTQDVCNDQKQLLCTKCGTRNCNTDIKRRGKKCFKCAGLRCFTPSYPSDVVDCLSNCYVGVNEKGESVRDCASEISSVSGCGAANSTCKVCNEDLCNSMQFPIQKRIKCHTCSNPDFCQANESNLDYCEKYGESEKCITVFSNDDRVIERACSSNLLNKLYCSQNYKNCFDCRGNGCNNINTKAAKQCVVCSSLSDPNCVVNPTTLSTKTCIGGCFTRLDNSTLIRGCASDLTVSCTKENQCLHCNDVNKCNTQNYPEDRKKCLTCNASGNCMNPTSQLCIKHRKNDSCVTLYSGCKFESKSNSILSISFVMM